MSDKVYSVEQIKRLCEDLGYRYEYDHRKDSILITNASPSFRVIIDFTDGLFTNKAHQFQEALRELSSYTEPKVPTDDEIFQELVDKVKVIHNEIRCFRKTNTIFYDNVQKISIYKNNHNLFIETNYFDVVEQLKHIIEILNANDIFVDYDECTFPEYENHFFTVWINVPKYIEDYKRSKCSHKLCPLVDCSTCNNYKPKGD